MIDVQSVIDVLAPLIDERLGGKKIDETTALMTSGLIDSLSVAELAEILSTTFKVDIDVFDLGVDNADTPAQLAKLISEKSS